VTRMPESDVAFADEVELPAPMCIRYSPAGPRREPAMEAILQWAKQPSNLLVVYGHVGAGKTWLLNEYMRAVTRQPPAARLIATDYEHVQREHASGGLVGPAADERDLGGVPPQIVLDNFDSVNSITGEQTSQPDLADVSRLLAAGYRVVLATRRSLADTTDELNRQLRNEFRWPSLGAKEPFVIALDPWSRAELREATQGRSERLSSVVTYLDRFDAILSEELRRPLMLKMMARLIDRLPTGVRPLSIAQLYDEYISWTLSVDYDRRRSAFRERHKQLILAELAYDIFSGQRGTRASAYTVTHDRMTSRVMEAVWRDPSLGPGMGPKSYEWVQDFVTTNHFLKGRDAPFHFDSQNREFYFAHASFFEYFVAQGILSRVASDSSLGVRPEALSEATFRSLVLYFVREYWSQSVEAAVGSIARRRLAWPDRLLLLYTMEMAEEFGLLLKDVDPKYFTELESALGVVQSWFIQKVIKYQLVIAGRYSAYEYVSEVRSQEGPADRAAERLLLSSGDLDLTSALVRRLMNENLKAGVPIAVYRLGQMGSRAAIPTLVTLVADARSPSETRRLAGEAIEQIRSRGD